MFYHCWSKQMEIGWIVYSLIGIGFFIDSVTKDGIFDSIVTNMIVDAIISILWPIVVGVKLSQMR